MVLSAPKTLNLSLLDLAVWLQQLNCQHHASTRVNALNGGQFRSDNVAFKSCVELCDIIIMFYDKNWSCGKTTIK